MSRSRLCDHCRVVLDEDVSLWVDEPAKTYSLTCDDCSIDHCEFVLGEHMPMMGGSFEDALSAAQSYERQGFNRGGPRLGPIKRGSD